MFIGLQRQKGGGQSGHRQVATGPDWVYTEADHRHMLAGLVRPGQLGSGQATPTRRRLRAAYKPRLGLGHWAAPGNNHHMAWCSVRPCSVPYPAYVTLCPCACVACHIQGSTLATRTTGPPRHQPTTGSSVCLAPCHMSMGRVPSPACIAPCAHAFCSMSHTEKAWQLRAPRSVCPSHVHGGYHRLHCTASP
jgi:hypothetical protein